MRGMLNGKVTCRGGRWRAALLALAAVIGTTLLGVTPAGATAQSATPATQVEGLDLFLDTQNGTDWEAVMASGRRFVYAIATVGADGDGFAAGFAAQTAGAREAGMFVGAYHMANPAPLHPTARQAATQANFFVENGGAWSAGSQTLPGVLMLGPDPNFQETCSFLTESEMVAWIQEFVDTYRVRTGRNPVIATSSAWWKQCTGGSRAFGSLPLWTNVNTPGRVPVLPDGWRSYTFLLYDRDPVPGVDGTRACETCEHEVSLDRFNGSEAQLLAFANNTH
jgi:GH25 family lysozyme M1 (1,4-beta-N-acetylmuramidase)